MRDLIFGLLDCAIAMFLFLPFFGQREGDFIRQVSLFSLTEVQWFIKAAYLTVVLLTIVLGITTLALQNYHGVIWEKRKGYVSVLLSMFGVLIFMASFQPYAAFFINVLEASYPSSTTMLVMCVMSTAMMQFHRLIQNKTVRIVVNILSGIFTVSMIVGRMLSGVHWFTDILGGILLSSTLIMLYYSVNVYIESTQIQQPGNSEESD